MTVVQLTGGRPRKASALKKLAGVKAKSKGKGKKSPASPLEQMPAAPSDLSPREVAAWAELARIVGPLRVAVESDMVAFRQMAVTLAVIEEAREVINDEGLSYSVSTESGTVYRKRPEVEILIAFKKQLSVELSRFGLTPADRERVSVLNDDRGVDPLDEFAIGGGGAA